MRWKILRLKPGQYKFLLDVVDKYRFLVEEKKGPEVDAARERYLRELEWLETVLENLAVVWDDGQTSLARFLGRRKFKEAPELAPRGVTDGD